MKIYLILLLSIFFLSSFVSANAIETYNVFEATIDQNGNSIITDIPITDVSAIGIVCSDLSCSSKSQDLFQGTQSTGTDNSITLTYPIDLQSQNGFGVYLFKEGFYPTEIHSQLIGSGDAGVINVPLERKATCSADIQQVTISASSIFDNEFLEVKATIESPTQESGPLDFTPSELASFQETEVLTTLELQNTATGEIVETQFQSLKISLSDSVEQTFTWTPGPTSIGEYKIIIKTNVPDNKCLLSSELIHDSQLFEVKSSSQDHLQITALQTTPSLPIINSGSEQELEITFDSTIYPISVSFELIYLPTNMQAHVKQTITLNSAADLPTTYTLPSNLPDGTYTLNSIISSNTESLTKSLGTITVDKPTQTTLDLSIISPEPITYTSSSVPITLSSTNAESVWFTVDGGEIENYSGSMQKFLENGEHTLTAYATDSMANQISKTITFTVSTLSKEIIIENVSPIPTNVTNSLEELQIIFNSNTFPLDIQLNLLDENGTIIDTEQFLNITQPNLSVTYTIPNTNNGQYTLEMTAVSGTKSFTTTIGTFTLNVPKDKEDEDKNRGSSGSTSRRKRSIVSNERFEDPSDSQSAQAFNFLNLESEQDSISLERQAKKDNFKLIPILLIMGICTLLLALIILKILRG